MNVPHDTAIARWDAARTQADKTARATGRSAADHSRYAAHEGTCRRSWVQVPAGNGGEEDVGRQFRAGPQAWAVPDVSPLHGTVVGLWRAVPARADVREEAAWGLPGRSGRPPCHPNCRCRLVLITEPTEPTKAAQHAKDVEKVSRR